MAIFPEDESRGSGLRFSTLDGWWCEGYTAEIGWVIGSDAVYENPQEQDLLESGAIYEILEGEVIPMFYDQESDGLPRQWIKRMKEFQPSEGSPAGGSADSLVGPRQTAFTVTS